MSKSIDLEELELLRKWAGEITIPNPNDSLVVVSGSILDESGNLCGAGFVRIVGEVTIALNPSLSRSEKANTIRQLFAEGINKSLEAGIDKWIAFTDSPLYARLLRKRFGFSSKSGIGLQLELL